MSKLGRALAAAIATVHIDRVALAERAEHAVRVRRALLRTRPGR